MTTITKSDPKGYLLIVLHAHMPFIRYPEHEEHLEEAWLHEAVIESYIPLLGVIQDLLNDGVDFRLTLSITPSLLEMLGDDLIIHRFSRYLEGRIELAEKEVFRTKNDPDFGPLSRMYMNRFIKSRHFFEDTCGKDLISPFRELSRSGKVELITSAATHAYLPLHMAEPAVIRTQLKTGVHVFKRHLGTDPRGLWLPECGYSAGLDSLISEAGAEYFFLESLGILNSKPKPSKSIYRPVKTPAGTVVFARDTESCKQVWSAAYGYPGDPDYRDFYRDIGFDLDHSYISPYLPGGIRTFTGFKYYRITGKTEFKEPYNIERAIMKAAVHAEHFMREREKQADVLVERLKIIPVITAAYDAELFGHWWHEGPEWLRFVLRNPAISNKRLRFTSPSEVLESKSVYETVEPSASSWGRGGYNNVWIDQSNSWIYKHLKKASSIMTELVMNNRGARGIKKRALDQALRELLLAQSSDWPFMIKTGSSSAFAENKIKEHIKNFFTLHNEIIRGDINRKILIELERKDNIFPDMDYISFR